MIKSIVCTEVTDQRSSEGDPPALWEVMGRPALSYALDLSEAFSNDPATVVIGSASDAYQEAVPNRTIDWVTVEEQTSFPEVLRQVDNGSDTDPDHLLFLRGDMPLVRARDLEKLITHHKGTDAAMTMLSGDGGEDGFSCELDEPTGEQKNAQSVRRPAAEDGERSASPVALVNQSKLDAVMDRGKVTEPSRMSAFLAELANQFLEQDDRVELYLGNDARDAKQVTTPEALAEATGILRERIISLLMEQGVKILSPDQTYIEPDVEIGEGTVIEPFVVIRNDVTIGSDCHLGPFCQIREGTHLEDQAEIGNYVETKNSQVGRKTKAKHLSYLGDATIGEQVNIGAGTITANYDGSNKHRTTIEDYASTGSNTVLIAPVTMKKGSKTGAGAVVCRGDDVEEGTTVVGVPARCVGDS